MVDSASTSPSKEWQIKKQKQEISDDGTKTFFWRAHTITVLFILMAVLVYESLFTQQVQDQTLNTKRYKQKKTLVYLYIFLYLSSLFWYDLLLFRGLIACASFFVLFGVTHTPDGKFHRKDLAFKLLFNVNSNNIKVHLFVLIQPYGDLFYVSVFCMRLSLYIFSFK